MKRLLLPIAAMLLLSACDAYDGIRTWVEYDPQTERLNVHARIENAGKAFFDCKTTEGCTDNIRQFVQGKATGPIPKAILGMADQGAQDLKVSVERDGDALDVLLWYTTIPGTVAAEATGVGIERTGAGKKTQTRMVVSYGDSRHVEDQKYERRIQYEPVSDGPEVKATQTWLLHKKATSVTVWEEPVASLPVTPILSEFEGLAEALEKGGVI